MTVRIGFIGVGGIAGLHLSNLATFPDVAITALCDVDEVRARARADEFKGKPYTDFRIMLDEEELDGLYICTPPFAHGEQERLACARGLPMFIEKPVANRMELAEEIHDLVEKHKITTSVGYHWRYLPSTTKAKTVLSGQKVLGVLGYWMGGMPKAPWWRERAKSGGQHVEQTTHIIDTCRYLVGGRATSVHGVAAQGAMATDAPNYDIDDISMINITFDNGVAANISSCCALDGWGRVGLEVFCRNLVIELERGKLSINRAGIIDNSLDGIKKGDRDRAFVDAVKSGDASGIKSNYADAVETLRISLAASQSFRTGKAVEI